MSKNFNNLFSDIKEDLSAYVNLKIKILQITLYEKTSTLFSLILYGLILLLVLFFAILFIFLALGLFLGELIGSASVGMALVAVLYLIVMGVLLFSKDKIQMWLTNLFIAEITKNDEEDETEE